MPGIIFLEFRFCSLLFGTNSDLYFLRLRLPKLPGFDDNYFWSIEDYFSYYCFYLWRSGWNIRIVPSFYLIERWDACEPLLTLANSNFIKFYLRRLMSCSCGKLEDRLRLLITTTGKLSKLSGLLFLKFFLYEQSPIYSYFSLYTSAFYS